MFRLIIILIYSFIEHNGDITLKSQQDILKYIKNISQYFNYERKNCLWYMGLKKIKSVIKNVLNFQQLYVDILMRKHIFLHSRILLNTAVIDSSFSSIFMCIHGSWILLISHNTHPQSVALYGSETWTQGKYEERVINASETWCWRRMWKIKWPDRITNDEVIQRAKEVRLLLKI